MKRQQKKRNEELDKIQAEREDEDFIMDDEEEEVEGYKVIRETVDSDIVEDDEEGVFDKWADHYFSWTKEYFENAGKKKSRNDKECKNVILTIIGMRGIRYRVLEVLW